MINERGDRIKGQRTLIHDLRARLAERDAEIKILEQTNETF